jgi:hypothetical protein
VDVIYGMAYPTEPDEPDWGEIHRSEAQAENVGETSRVPEAGSVDSVHINMI